MSRFESRSRRRALRLHHLTPSYISILRTVSLGGLQQSSEEQSTSATVLWTEQRWWGPLSSCSGWRVRVVVRRRRERTVKDAEDLKRRAGDLSSPPRTALSQLSAPLPLHPTTSPPPIAVTSHRSLHSSHDLHHSPPPSVRRVRLSQSLPIPSPCPLRLPCGPASMCC